MEFLRKEWKDRFERYMEGKASEGEMEVLLTAMSVSETRDQWVNLIAEVYLEHPEWTTDRNLQPVLDKVVAEINAIPEQKGAIKISEKVVHRIHFIKSAWFRYAAALLIFIGIGAYLWMAQSKKENPDTAPINTTASHDILPGSQKATLTLSSGERIDLTPLAKQQFDDHSSVIRNANGILMYEQSNVRVFNTMTTPRGGQYQLALPDGSRVWLNAASSITYPTAFTDSIREVNIKGEAYFEVVKMSRKPFMVKTPGNVITVMGTSFNINAYPDESVEKTSLREGAIKVNDRLLLPGESYAGGKVSRTRIEQDLAWKNGLFNFEGLEFQQVMRQIGRWYDIEVRYEGAVPSVQVLGEMGKDLTLQEVLGALSNMKVHYRIEGRRLTILP